MRIYTLLLIAFVLSSCGSSKKLTYLEPHQPDNYFLEQGKQFSYESKDDVIVSIAYDGLFNNEHVFDLSIDNQSDSSVFFDPEKAYLFCYDSALNTSLESLYFANNPDSVINDISQEIEEVDKKVKRNTILSILLGIAYISADIALASNDMPAINRDILSLSHMTTQIIMDETRLNDLEKLDNLSYSRCNVENEIHRNAVIEPEGFHTGKLHFSIPTSTYYNLYLPMNGRIYQFEFVSQQKD